MASQLVSIEIFLWKQYTILFLPITKWHSHLTIRMEDPSYYTGSSIIDGYSEESKTYVELEVIGRNPNPTYDPAALELAHQSELLFNYDSSPITHDPIITGPVPQQIFQFHDYDHVNQSAHHIIDLDSGGASTTTPFDSIKSMLMYKDHREGPPMQHHQLISSQMTTEKQNSNNCSEAQPLPQHLQPAEEYSSGPLPFWKERALQIERGERCGANVE